MNWKVPFMKGSSHILPKKNLDTSKTKDEKPSNQGNEKASNPTSK